MSTSETTPNDIIAAPAGAGGEPAGEARGERPSASEKGCPLCGHRSCAPFARDGSREYLSCPVCALVHVPRAYHLSPVEEKRRYDTHRNSPEDAGYRRFLSRLIEPLAARLGPGAEGLDYGSGPGPTLSIMFREAGHAMRDYDPFYAPDEAVLQRRYDFVTCTETAEHFARPGEEFARLLRLVRPGGWLGVMTQMLEPQVRFDQWYYKRDPTHVAFYSEASFRWLAAAYRLHPLFVSSSVILLRRPD